MAWHAADADNNGEVGISDVIAQLKHGVGLKELDAFDLIDANGNAVHHITSETTNLQLVLNGDVNLSTTLHNDYVVL